MRGWGRASMELPSASSKSSGAAPRSPAATALILLTALAILLATRAGNARVAAAVTTSPALRVPHNLFLVSLASADILLAVLVLAHELMGCWPLGRPWCRLYLALDVLLCTASVGHLCAIGLDRC